MKKKYNILFSIALAAITGFTANAQTNQSPKREFRGVWVATVKNIDWPSKPGLNSNIQKEELIKIFDEHEKNGINAIMFQIRPSADAFYAKSEELWSAFIAGEQGKGPTPFYDPLEFAIAEAHKRGMELHAWFNPYRATNDDNEKLVSPNHITHQKPELFFTYAKKKFFNPGLPEVRTYINKIIMNVVRNYDIDGVHFDDYFYPYPGKEAMPDSTTFAQYPNGFDNVEDWRRNNVDLLIKAVADSIKAEKNYVKFGISPFGIWRNQKEDPRGSETNGMAGYSALYADVLKWTELGWIDYVNPQVYFPFGYKPAAYEVLTDWWANNAYGKHVYIGHGNYRLVEEKNGWNDKTQMPRQIRYLRNKANIQGSVYFSSKSVTNNLGGFQDSLRVDLNKNKALQPTMSWLDSTLPAAPEKLKAKNGKLAWEKPADESVYGYVVYRSEGKKSVDISNPKNIVKIIFGANNTQFEDLSAKNGVKYTYVLTSLDRLKNESEASKAVRSK